MSPLWRNQLRVVLCPDQVIILGLGKGLRRRVIFQTILPCVSVSNLPNWQPALDAFAYWLSSFEMGKTDVSVFLSSCFVRYAVMPYSIELNSREEQQALAQILFEDIYGERSRQWKLEVGQGGYGEASLIAAVDALLLDKVTILLNAGPLRLKGIAPYFVSAFNCFHEQIQTPDGLFVVVEAGQMQLVVFKQAQLSGVCRVPLNGKWEEQLPILLQREALTTGLNPEATPVYLHVVGRPDFKLSYAGGMTIHVLRCVGKNSSPSAVDARFDMAFSGG